MSEKYFVFNISLAVIDVKNIDTPEKVRKFNNEKMVGTM